MTTEWRPLTEPILTKTWSDLDSTETIDWYLEEDELTVVFSELQPVRPIYNYKMEIRIQLSDDYEWEFTTPICGFKIGPETKKWKNALWKKQTKFDSFNHVGTKIGVVDSAQFNFSFYKQDDTWFFREDLSGIVEDGDRYPVRCVASRTLARSTADDFHLFTGRTYSWGFLV